MNVVEPQPYTIHMLIPIDELGNWRPERNKFTRSYFNAYHSYIPKAKPEEDYDDRNALYSMFETFGYKSYPVLMIAGVSIFMLRHYFQR